VLNIYRESVKLGRAADHEKLEHEWATAFIQSNAPVHYLAMTSITGPSEAWFISGYDTYAAWEKEGQDTDKNTALTARIKTLAARDADLLTGAQGLTAVFRPELSYKPVGISPAMRTMQVITFHVKPGQDAGFTTVSKAYAAAYEKAGVDLPWATYEVTNGVPGSTFLVFFPMTSLSALDQDAAAGKSVRAALADADGLSKTWGEVSQGSESQLFVFNPKMGVATKEFAKADAKYWTR
jgi:hypothetical protein